MTPRKRLATTGHRGNLVRLFLDTNGREKHYRVQWGPRGARQQESWPADARGKSEAEAFFKAFGETMRQEASASEPLTVRGMWVAYLEAEADHLRPRSILLYSGSWRKWEQHVKPDAVAEQLDIRTIHDFRKRLDDQNLETATVKACIANVRIVYNWAERMELITRNRWHLFVHKVAKEKRTKPRAEFSSAEFVAIWKALNPKLRGQWRPWVAIGLLGIYGNRQNEILQLQWSWIDGDYVHIPGDVVKTGEASTLKLFTLTKSILEVARRWAEAEGYTGPYVLFAGKGRSRTPKNPYYSIQSVTDHIHRAEARVGITAIKWRAGHGFRRGLVGDLADETGDVMFALQAIGDRDVRMASRYRVRRNDKVNAAVAGRAGRLFGQSATECATNVQPTPQNKAADPMRSAAKER